MIDGVHVAGMITDVSLRLLYLILIGLLSWLALLAAQPRPKTLSCRSRVPQLMLALDTESGV